MRIASRLTRMLETAGILRINTCKTCQQQGTR